MDDEARKRLLALQRQNSPLNILRTQRTISVNRPTERTYEYRPSAPPRPAQPSYGGGFRGAWNKFKDVTLDANTAQDRWRRQMVGSPLSYQDEQKAMGARNVYTNPLGSFIMKAGAEDILRGANTAGKTVQKIGSDIYDTADLARISALGTDKEYQDKLNRIGARQRAPIGKNSGAFGVGANIDSFEDLKDPKKFAVATVKTGADLAQLVPAGAAAEGAYRGVRLASKPVIGTGVISGASNVASEAGRQYQDTGKVDARSLAVAFGMGTALPIAGYGFGKLSRKITNFFETEAGDNLLKDLARETDEATINNVVREALPGADEATTRTVTRDLVKATTPDAVKQVITSATKTPSVSREVITQFRNTKTPQETNDAVRALFPELDEPTTADVSTRLAAAKTDDEVSKVIQEAQARQAAVKETVEQATPTGQEVAPNSEQARNAQQLEQAVTEQPVAPQTPPQAPEEIAQAIDQPAPVQNATNDVQVPQAVQAKGASFKTIVGNKFVDDDYYIIQELKNIEKQTGQKGILDKFMYESGLARKANSIATNKFTQSANIERALSNLGKDGLDGFNVYAAARRELANAREGLATSKPIKELQAIVARGAEFEPRYNALRDYYFELAADMRSAGLIDEAKYQQFISDPDYVRLQRDFEDVFQTGQQGKSYNLGTTIASQKRIGSRRNVLPVGETALEYTQKIQTEIQRNQVGKGLIDVLMDSGQAREISQKEAARRNVIKVLDDGRTRYFEVSKDMKEAVQRISPFQLDIVGKIFAAPGRLFRAGTTGLNPVFIAKNFTKDQATQAVMSNDAVATSKYFLDGLGQALKDFGIDNNDPTWNKFLAVAGDTTSYDMTRNIKKSSAVVKGMSGAKNRYGQMVLRPISTLEDFASITEKATRFQGFKGIYEKAIKSGMSEGEALQQATLAAWQNTVDFNRAGQWGRVANLMVPYINPGIQGSRQLIRRGAEAPAKTLLKGTAFIGVPLTAATVWNMSDPERRKAYENIPEYEKQGNLILLPPTPEQNADGTYDAFKLPLPPGISNLYQPFRRGVEVAMGNSVDPVKIAADMLEAFSGPIKLSEPSQNVSTFTPQIVKPVVQAVTNRDLYTGNKIVPDYIENADVEAKDKAFDSTSGTARFFGNALNKSPIKVERFVKDTFGTVGSQLLNATDRTLAKFGKIPDEQIGGQSISEGYAKAFTKTSSIENYNKSEGAKFYDTVEAAVNNIGLNKTEKEAFFGTVMPSRKDFTGSVLNDKTYFDSASKATTYLRYPKTFEVSKAIDAANRAEGKPGDPLFDLPPDQLRIVLNMQSKVSPGNMEDDAIKQLNPWIEDFNDKRGAFFDTIKESQKAKLAELKTEYAQNPKDTKLKESIASIESSLSGKDAMGLEQPQSTPEIEKKIEEAKKLEGKDKALYFEANPDLTDYYDQLDTYQRNKRAFLGLPQFDKYPEAPPEIDKLMKEYSALPKGNGPLKKDGTPSSPDRSAWIKAHPAEWEKMTEQWNKISLWNLQRDGALAVYEGIDMPQETVDQYIAGGSGGSGSGYGRFGYGGGSSKEQTDRQYLSQLLTGVGSNVAPAPEIKTKPNRSKFKVKTPSGKGRRFKRVKLT